jgi:hypothetical protein
MSRLDPEAREFTPEIVPPTAIASHLGVYYGQLPPLRTFYVPPHPAAFPQDQVMGLPSNYMMNAYCPPIPPPQQYLTVPRRSTSYSRILRRDERKIKTMKKITDLPTELLSIILEDDCLEREDLVKVTQVCRKLSEPATNLLFHTLSTTVLDGSSFDMRWSELLKERKLSRLVQVVHLKPEDRYWGQVVRSKHRDYRIQTN